MNYLQLKSSVCAEIDRYSEQIKEIGRFILRNPELGYREQKTCEYIRSLLGKAHVPYDTHALTGVRAQIGSGINVAVFSELDAVVSRSHPFSDPSDGAAHACGHNAQVASMMGVLYGLINHMDKLDGSLTLFAIPAEEFIETEYRSSLISQGKIKYMSGKQQLIYEGAFDDIDIAMMVHSAADCPEPELFSGGTSLGFIAKNITIRGKEAHAGSPHQGINALNAAVLAINAINANRETFRDDDSVRIHQILTKGGDIVNIIPSDIRMEMMVRGSSIEAIDDAGIKVNRSIHGASMALGATAKIIDTPGYLPLWQSEDLTCLFEQNAAAFIHKDKLRRNINMTGSTDMGDLSALIPCIHPSMGGFSGNAHSCEFTVADEDTAYIMPAKILAMTVIDLLSENAERAKRIKTEYKARMTKVEYLAYLDKFTI